MFETVKSTRTQPHTAAIAAGLGLFLSWGFVYLNAIDGSAAQGVTVFANRIAITCGYAGIMVFALFFARLIVPMQPARHLPFLVLAVVGVFLGGYSYLVPSLAPALCMLGSFAVGLDYGWHLLFWSELFGFTTSKRAAASIAGSFLIIPLIVLVANIMPHGVQVAIAAVLPILSHLGFSLGMKTMRDTEPGGSAERRAGKVKMSEYTLRLPWRTSELFRIMKPAMATTLVISLLFGVVDNVYGSLHMWAAAFGLLGLGVIALAFAAREKLTIVLLHRIGCLCMAAGLLALPFSHPLGGVLVSTAFCANLFLLLLTLSEVANRFETSVVRLAGFAFSMALVTAAAGKFLGAGAITLLQSQGMETALLTSMLLLLFMAYSIFSRPDGGYIFGFSGESMVNRSKPDRSAEPDAKAGVAAAAYDMAEQGIGAEGELDPRDMEVSRIVFYEAVNRRCSVVAAQYGLSNREEEVLAQIMKGYSIQTVADKLFISPGTVKTHINHIYKKMGITSREQLKQIVNLEQ